MAGKTAGQAVGKKNSGGKRPGSGRKPKATEGEVVDLFDRAWPDSEKIAVVKAMVTEAKAGNVKAASLLFAYRFGKPKEQVEHSGAIDTGITVVIAQE